MARCWTPPGYSIRAAQAFKAAWPSGNKTRFAKAKGFEGYQVGRWLRVLPDNHEDLARFAAALEVSWQDLIVGPLIGQIEKRIVRNLEETKIAAPRLARRKKG